MDLGAELAAGGQAGKGQSLVAGTGLGKELSANWLKPAIGNLATGLASEAPSFRSSWQSQLNAWRGVPRGTNGVESQDTSEAGTVITISGVPKSLTAKLEQTLPAAQGSSSRLRSIVAGTKQNESIPDVTGQKKTLPDTGRSTWKAVEKPFTQIESSGSADGTATEHPGSATRSRADSAAPAVNQENAAPAATVGAQAIAPAIAVPVQLPTAPAQLQIPTLAQTGETTPVPGPNLAPSNWSSTEISGSMPLSRSAQLSGGSVQLSASPQNSGSAQLSGPAPSSRSAQPSGQSQLPGPQSSSAEETVSVATSEFAAGAPGSDGAAGGRTQRVHADSEFNLRNTTKSAATHEAPASATEDAEEPTASQQITSLSSPDPGSTESWHQASIVHAAPANEELLGQPVPTSSPGNLVRPVTVESIARHAAPAGAVTGLVQTGPDTVQEPLKPSADRATTHATNRDATGESAAGAPQISAVHPTGVDAAASSGLRNPGASQISTASTAHNQPIAAAASTGTTSAASTTQDTISALDTGTSPSTPAWTHGGSQHAEAGFRDPALGWVSVRADQNASGIHATLVPSSAEAAQALNAHLAGLSTHLVEQQSTVASVTMAAPNDGGVENGMGQRMQQGAEGNPQGNAREEAQAGAQENAPPASSTSVLDAPAQSGTRDSLTHTGDLRGTHISVMA